MFLAKKTLTGDKQLESLMDKAFYPLRSDLIDSLLRRADACLTLDVEWASTAIGKP
jgi:hypothetical protein